MTQAGLSVGTYHCICLNLVLASTRQLDTLSTRTGDRSSIVQLKSRPTSSLHTAEYNAELIGTILDLGPVVVRKADGFEKRWLQKCSRCGLVVGYHLDKSQYEGVDQQGVRDDLVYILPGGLQTTSNMNDAIALQATV